MRSSAIACMVFVGLWITSAAAAPVMLRHVNVVALQLQAGGQGAFRIEGIRHGYAAYQDRLDCRLIRRDGTIAHSAGALSGESVDLGLAGEAPGRLALVVDSGWNLAVLHPPADLPWALRAGVGHGLQTVREWGPLYFYVPAGTRHFSLWIQASVTHEAAHAVVTRPDGTSVVDRESDFDQRTQIQVKVGAGHDGKAWGLALVRCTTPGFVTDDVTIELGNGLPGFLAPTPQCAALFGDEHSREALPSHPRRKRQARKPAPPYHPPPSGVLAWAYARRSGTDWRTSLPVTYVLDYGSKHVGNDAYVSTVATAPPTLLHLGKDVPFNHAWGPIHALGGENQAYGYGDYIKRISPAEVHERIETLTAMTDKLHKVGVRFLTPYICGMTVNGDYEKRTGFWEFYDHWDEYRGLGLGPRPVTDPRQWLQTTPDGKPRIYYGYDMTKGYYPPFKTNHRFAACWHTQGWRTWLLDVVRFVARCGYDGVFVDNATSQRSMSAAALAAFREYLRDKYSTAQVRNLLGIPDMSKLSFPDPKAHSLLAVELHRFWCRTVHDELAAIKDAGTRVLARDFVVFPNGGRPAYIQDALRDADFVMFEKSVGEYGTHPGLVFCPIFDDLKMRVINDNIFEYTFVRSLRERVRPIILSRPGYPRSQPWLRMNLDAARLGLAECAAFSGGGAFLLRPRFTVYRDALNEYRAFFEQHPELYAGLLPYTQTAILALPEQEWTGNPGHLAAVRRITPPLADAHVLFEYLSRRRLETLVFPEVRTVGTFDVRVLSKTQLSALAKFVVAGGTLVVAGTFGGLDAYLQPRPALPVPLAAVSRLKDGQRASRGKGLLIRTVSDTGFVQALAANAVNVSRDDGRPTAGIRLNAYQTPDSRRIVVHIVNYNVPLGTNPNPIEEVSGLHLRLPLPAKSRVTVARWLSPAAPSSTPVRVAQSGGSAAFALPALHIYAVVDVRLTGPGD